MATVDAPETASAQRSPAPEHCPHCGSELRPGQEWCLTCGAEVRAQVAPTPAWRTPVALLAGVLALCAAALVVAFVAISDDPEQVVQAPATTAPAPAAPAPPTADPNAVPADPNAAPGTDPNAPPATDPALPEGEASPADPGAAVPPATGEGGGGATGSGIEEWPPGRTAWTAIVASEPSRSAAVKKAQALVDGGTAVGVLNSDDYPSLNPGYWVVFFGQYDSRSAAESAAEGLGSTAPEAYARKVSPS